ncbi:hypothetical protein NWE48_23610 [Escherichia coli]|nr:hypothetical protein [Escherichia coli]
MTLSRCQDGEDSGPGGCGQLSGRHGATANTLQVEGHRCVRESLNGQTVSVMANNGATVTPTLSSQGRTAWWGISATSQTAGINAVTQPSAALSRA